MVVPPALTGVAAPVPAMGNMSGSTGVDAPGFLGAMRVTDPVLRDGVFAPDVVTSCLAGAAVAITPLGVRALKFISAGSPGTGAEDCPGVCTRTLLALMGSNNTGGVMRPSGGMDPVRRSGEL